MVTLIRQGEADLSLFFAFVEAAILAGHMIITRCADPDRESAINIDVDRLFSCIIMFINTIIVIVIVIAMISITIISSKTMWNRLLGLKEEEEEGDYDDVYGDYDPDAELL